MYHPEMSNERPSPRRLPEILRRRAGATVVDNLFRALAGLGRLHPQAQPHRHQVEVVRDVPYRPTGSPAHLLDIYRPTSLPGPWPVVLYIHGGGFRILSKDTHWVMGLAFARRGFLVFNINYRLAPKHRYPAAVEDAAAAYAWVARHAADYGGDLSRFVIAGESAGANLATVMAACASYERPEPAAREVFATGLVPRAAVAACGMLQVTDPERFRRRKRLPSWVYDRIIEVSDAYVGGAPAPGPEMALADPLVLLESAAAPLRPLPAFFAPVGTRDPILDDTRRLKLALDRLGVPCEARYYPGEVHAFHALVFRENARLCWTEAFRFLDEHVGPLPRAATRRR